jgi:hypothetical protein
VSYLNSLSACRGAAHAGRSRLLAGAVAASLCASAHSQVLSTEPTAGAVDSFTPYASIRYTYDSNIFRLDSDAPEIGERDDHLLTFAVGADSDISLAKQRYELGAQVNHTMFEAHDEFDYTGGRALARWHWATAGTTVGTLGYQYSRTLRDFANQPAFERVKDLRSEHRVAGSADFALPGQWRLGLRGDFADIAFSETKRLDLQRAMAGVNVGYASFAGSIIGLDAEFTRGRYDTNPVADFDEITVGPTLDWRPTERTRVEAQVGYTERDNVSPSRPDYDDVTGQFVANFDNQAGRKVKFRAWREITNIGDEVAGYALVNGVSLEPSWQLSAALGLRVRAAYERRDFQVTDEANEREDKIASGGVFADWNPRRNVTVTFGGDLGNRSSSRQLQDYDFGRVQLQFIARF